MSITQVKTSDKPQGLSTWSGECDKRERFKGESGLLVIRLIPPEGKSKQQSNRPKLGFPVKPNSVVLFCFVFILSPSHIFSKNDTEIMLDLEISCVDTEVDCCTSQTSRLQKMTYYCASQIILWYLFNGCHAKLQNYSATIIYILKTVIVINAIEIYSPLRNCWNDKANLFVC